MTAPPAARRHIRFIRISLCVHALLLVVAGTALLLLSASLARLPASNSLHEGADGLVFGALVTAGGAVAAVIAATLGRHRAAWRLAVVIESLIAAYLGVIVLGWVTLGVASHPPPSWPMLLVGAPGLVAWNAFSAVRLLRHGDVRAALRA